MSGAGDRLGGDRRRVRPRRPALRSRLKFEGDGALQAELAETTGSVCAALEKAIALTDAKLARLDARLRATDGGTGGAR